MAYEKFQDIQLKNLDNPFSLDESSLKLLQSRGIFTLASLFKAFDLGEFQDFRIKGNPLIYGMTELLRFNFLNQKLTCENFLEEPIIEEIDKKTQHVRYRLPETSVYYIYDCRVPVTKRLRRLGLTEDDVIYLSGVLQVIGNKNISFIEFLFQCLNTNYFDAYPNLKKKILLLTNYYQVKHQQIEKVDTTNATIIALQTLKDSFAAIRDALDARIAELQLEIDNLAKNEQRKRERN